MAETLTYRDYVDDAAHMAHHSEQQRKYAESMPERDKILIGKIKERLPSGARKSLLDLGCSTGNFLLHLKHALPSVELHGTDIVGSIIAQNRANADLKGVEFFEADMLDLTPRRTFDFVVTNAALMFFDDEEFDRAIHGIGRLLAKGGVFIAFDLFHPFEQEITVVERSKLHPRGLKLSFRSYKVVRAALEKAGLVRPNFEPFSIPIDLPRPEDPSDISSYSVRSVTGEGLVFRGSLGTPWCHMTAEKFVL